MRVLALFSALVIIVELGFLVQPAHGSVVFLASGTSGKGVAVSFEAEFTISGDTLTLQLTNNSPVATLNPDDTLSSFYFDILDISNNRPTLTYFSAVGDVYLADKDNPDALQTANADIKAVLAGDDSWMYQSMDAAQNPFVGFGIGTVGNGTLSPNNFQGSIVDGMDYSIYRDEITTANLNGQLLVKDTATFTFTGLTGFTEGDIASTFAFGLGTAPDSLLVPEPSSVLLLGIGVFSVLGRIRRKRSL